jgi:hypothetical protein
MEVQGFENYLIYEDGRIFSKKSNKFRKSVKNSYGYHYISLYKDGKEKKHRIHRLIAIHYLPNPENLPEIDHINRVSTDNRVQNLRWCSRLENAQNKGKRNNNTTGHNGVSYNKIKRKWAYQKRYHRKKIQKCFKTKAEALCYKYIILLKIKSGIF